LIRMTGSPERGRRGTNGNIAAYQQLRQSQSRLFIAIISGIYNASPNCIQRAMDVENPVRRVRHYTDATIKYPAFEHSDIITSLLRRRWRRHISIFPNVSTLPLLPNDHVVGIGFTFARTWSVIRSRRHTTWHLRGRV
jgi:hypothetical protein